MSAAAILALTVAAEILLYCAGRMRRDATRARVRREWRGESPRGKARKC